MVDSDRLMVAEEDGSWPPNRVAAKKDILKAVRYSPPKVRHFAQQITESTRLEDDLDLLINSTMLSEKEKERRSMSWDCPRIQLAKDDVMMAVHKQGFKHGAFQDVILLSTTISKDLEILSKSPLLSSEEKGAFRRFGGYLYEQSYETSPVEKKAYRAVEQMTGRIYDRDMWNRGVWGKHLMAIIKEMIRHRPQDLTLLLYTTEDAKDLMHSCALQARLDPKCIFFTTTSEMIFPFFHHGEHPLDQGPAPQYERLVLKENGKSGNSGLVSTLDEPYLKSRTQEAGFGSQIQIIAIFGASKLGDWGVYGADGTAATNASIAKKSKKPKASAPPRKTHSDGDEIAPPTKSSTTTNQSQPKQKPTGSSGASGFDADFSKNLRRGFL